MTLAALPLSIANPIVLLGRHDFTPMTHQMPRFDWVTHSLLDGTGAPVPTN